MIAIRSATLPLNLALALAALGGCRQSADKPVSNADAQASETAADSPISGARLILPAVKGNPGGGYFALKNATTGTLAISSVAIDGVGKAEMHQTVGSEMTPVDRVDVSPGTSIVFEPGKLHIMAFDVAGSLKAGGQTRLTVTYASGDKVSAPMTVEAAGAAAMGGMDMGHDH